jgi:hypothetical protein
MCESSFSLEFRPGEGIRVQEKGILQAGNGNADLRADGEEGLKQPKFSARRKLVALT